MTPPASSVRWVPSLALAPARYGWLVAALVACVANTAPDAGTPGGTGVCRNSRTSPYVLPYLVGTTYVCSHGPVGGDWHHAPPFEHAMDFTMLLGSAVTAARAGIVEYVEQRFSDTDAGISASNVVVVDHGDGTFARYVHLTQNGAAVEVGEAVEAGDTIGWSGSSGAYPNAPHLHFDVTTGCSQTACQTIPVCFRNTKSHPNGMVSGEAYTAERY